MTLFNYPFTLLSFSLKDVGVTLSLVTKTVLKINAFNKHLILSDSYTFLQCLSFLSWESISRTWINHSSTCIFFFFCFSENKTSQCPQRLNIAWRWTNEWDTVSNPFSFTEASYSFVFSHWLSIGSAADTEWAPYCETLCLFSRLIIPAGVQGGKKMLRGSPRGVLYTS